MAGKIECPHHCPLCQLGWLHEVNIIENHLLCRLKRVATCDSCLKEFAYAFSKVLKPPVHSLEDELWGEAQEA